MEQWHYDPATDFDEALIERLQGYPRRLNFLVCSVRSITAAVLRFWLRIYHRLTIVGRQNLPAAGSYVLVANHASHLDTLCLLAALPMRRLQRVFPIAAEDYFFRSGPRTILATLVVNALRFNRQFAPWQCLSACAHLLQRPGTILIFFPEGRRAAGVAPGNFKPGAALLAAGRDVPVVPCHLDGTDAALPKGAWCPRPRAVRLTIGAPRLYTHLAPTKESARQISHELREAVMLLGQASQQETSRKEWND
jgi:1-acyl-sn-glycerol-3-phosphate acyltransferase